MDADNGSLVMNSPGFGLETELSGESALKRLSGEIPKSGEWAFSIFHRLEKERAEHGSTYLQSQKNES